MLAERVRLHVKVGVLYLHGDTKALVEGHEPSAADDLFEAVDEPCELAGAGLAQVSCQPGTGKVQGIHNQQRSSSGQTTCKQSARVIKECLLDSPCQLPASDGQIPGAE